MTPDEIKNLVIEMLGNYLVPDTTYAQPLPADLQPWYCYVVDSGHSIAVVLTRTMARYPNDPPEEQLVPAPVKAVLRGYTVRHDGFIEVDLPYDNDLGLITDPADDEF